MLGKSLILHDTSPLRPTPPLRRPRGEIIRGRASHRRRRCGAAPCRPRREVRRRRRRGAPPLPPLRGSRREPAPGVDLGFPPRRSFHGPLVRRERDGGPRAFDSIYIARLALVEAVVQVGIRAAFALFAGRAEVARDQIVGRTLEPLHLAFRGANEFRPWPFKSETFERSLRSVSRHASVIGRIRPSAPTEDARGPSYMLAR